MIPECGAWTWFLRAFATKSTLAEVFQPFVAMQERHVMKTVLVAVLAALMAMAFIGCSTKEETGTFAGGAAGAAIGHGLGGGTVGTVLGALGGAYLGKEAGKYLDSQDREQVADTLENQQTGQTSSWTNPDSGKSYQVTP